MTVAGANQFVRPWTRDGRGLGRLLMVGRLVMVAFGVSALSAWAWTPFIDILSPPSAVRGTRKPVALRIRGANFVAGAIVDFDGVKLKPDFNSMDRRLDETPRIVGDHDTRIAAPEKSAG